MTTKGKFIVEKITSFDDLLKGKEDVLPESDLCFQNEEGIVQFKYKSTKNNRKLSVKPGMYLLTQTQMGIIPEKTELHKKKLLESITNTQTIINEANTFFDRLHVYDKLQRPKKRGVLLYSAPGMGKSMAISDFCNKAMQEDPGTVVFVWPTSDIESSVVSKFLSVNSKFTPKCTRLVLIIEDIGGGEREGNYGSRGVDAGMLNLLDGLEVTFKLPTFIIATTNYPENLLKELADRPGRFDLMLELDPPTSQERIDLVEFLLQSPMSLEDKEAIKSEKYDNFSLAHVEEIVVRSLLHDKSLSIVAQELLEHSKRFKREFSKDSERNIGF